MNQKVKPRDSPDTYFYHGDIIANDGGQIESFHLKKYSTIFLPENQRGKWVEYASGANYAYNIADAQLSYDTTKLDFFRRRLLYINPEKVIVLDHVHLKNRSTNQRDIKWIAHFAKRPIISGNIINTSVPGHIETYNGDTYSVTNGNGSIAIKTLLPDSSTTTLIGGTGYEYWVDGTNYPPTDNPDTTFYTPGSWRIEVKPTVLTDTVVYLHIIDIGDSINTAVANGTALQNTFSVGVDWNDTLYYFSNDADTGKVYHVFTNVTGGRTIGIFAADLIVGSYYIKVDGMTIATVSSDGNGIIQSSLTLTAGNHMIEIVLIPTHINELYRTNILTVFPNPTYLELNIALSSSQPPFGIKIYDINGKLVMKKSNQLKLDISSLSPGHYFIQVIQDNNYYSTKFIKH